MSLREYAEYAVKKCEKLGASEAEAYGQKQRVIEIVLERGEIQSERTKTHLGISIRLIKDKKLGFAYNSTLSKESIEKACEAAFALAKASIPNPDWISLPSMSKPSRSPEGIFDQRIAELKSAEILDFAIQAANAVKEKDKKAFVDDGKFSALINETSIVNSHGISCAEKTTLFSCYLICMAKEMGKASSMVFEYEITRSIEKFSPTKLGEKAAEKAVASINPKSVESFEGQVLLDCDPAAVILAYPIMNSVNADNVQRNRSLWAGRIGEEVANPTLSVVDDGLLPRGVYSSAFDDEGVPRQRTEILAKGVLKGYLHNSFTSNKENKASTGNAYRQNYATLPTVMASNMIIQPGNKKLEEIISEIDKGIIIRRFSGNVRPESGEFSGIAKQASLIENGEIKHALKETMIAGNTFEALKNIITIGSEIRATLYRAYVPPILVDKIKIVSK